MVGRGQRPSKGKGREEIAHALGLSRQAVHQAVHQAAARTLARLRTVVLRRQLANDPASHGAGPARSDGAGGRAQAGRAWEKSGAEAWHGPIAITLAPVAIWQPNESASSLLHQQ